MLLCDGEKIEDLQCGGLRIIQNERLYRFNADSVLLANLFAGGGDMIDVGAGSGVLSLLCYVKYLPKSVTAVEIQKPFADMCERSVELNCLQDKISVVCADVKTYAAEHVGEFDCAVCNPPYFRASGNVQDASRAMCREETALSLCELATSCALLLKETGRVWLCYPAERQNELVSAFAGVRLAVKKITPVVERKGNPARIVIVEALKGGAEGFEICPSIVMRDENGETQQLKDLYNRRPRCFVFNYGE